MELWGGAKLSSGGNQTPTQRSFHTGKLHSWLVSVYPLVFGSYTVPMCVLQAEELRKMQETLAVFRKVAAGQRGDETARKLADVVSYLMLCLLFHVWVGGVDRACSFVVWV